LAGLKSGYEALSNVRTAKFKALKGQQISKAEYNRLPDPLKVSFKEFGQEKEDDKTEG
jgi:hypothetical protein